MALSFLPGTPTELKPRITVIGVGGAGGNAVNNMIASRLEGVEFIVANTDAQSLAQSRTENRIQLGTEVTQGLGAGSRPEIGRAAAEESMQELTTLLSGCNMVFITAGMGGGTGTGAAPVIARAAREMNILTVGVVTKPFHFEGAHRMRTAESGIEELSQFVDTLIIIPNQNLFRIATERTTFADAFKMADDVLHSGVRGVTDLMIMPGLINLDFADIRTVMSEMGKAMMGTGEAEGDKRSIEAAEAAISNPLLDDTSMKGAKGVLINITGGMDMTLFEVDEAANRIRDEVDPDANIIFGSTFDEKLTGRMRVSVVATGIQSEVAVQPKPATVVQLAEKPLPPQRLPTPAVAPTQAAYAVPPRPTMTQQPYRAATAPAARTTATAARAQQPAMDQHIEPDHHSLFDHMDSGMERNYQPEPAPAPRPQPQQATFRTEPNLGRPAPQYQPQQPQAQRPEADMNSMHRALNDISTAEAPAHHHAPVDEQRRSGSMFDRILQRRPAATPTRPSEPIPAPQQRMGNMETRRETTATRQPNDDLDIPAFLRRQAN
jgi:cell division protein FtsZ